MKMGNKIFVLGDVVRHIYLKPFTKGDESQPNEGNTKYEKVGKYIAFTQNMMQGNDMICHPIIKEMIYCAIPDLKPADTVDNPKNCEDCNQCLNSDIIKPKYIFRKDKVKNQNPNLQLFRILGYYPRRSDKTKSEDKEDKKVLRVNSGAEYFASELKLSGSKTTKQDYDLMDEFFCNNVKESDDLLDILVLYDRNSELREYIKEQWKKNNEDFKNKLKIIFSTTQKAIVIGIREIKKAEKWLEILKQIISSNSKARNKCVVVVTADDLREAGLNITEHGTIEQNIREIVAYLEEKEGYLKLIYDDICEHLVVIFRENQALYLNKTSGEGSFHSCPHFDRPAHIRPAQYGKMPGKFTIQVTSIVKHIYQNDGFSNDSIAKALRFGIAAYNSYFDIGYCNDKDNDKSNNAQNPFDAIKKAVCHNFEKKLYDLTWDKKEKELFISSLNFNIARIKRDIDDIKYFIMDNKIGNTLYLIPSLMFFKQDHWSRVDSLFDYHKKSESKLENDVLFDIVKLGLEFVTQKPNPSTADKKDFSEYKIICPHAEFGGIKIIDENHMNGLIDLTQLIRIYLNPNHKFDKPLSIAVFGRPGEGKSYSVKQLIKHISPERKSEELTFNLAQFDSVDQLTESFHKVQHQVLKYPGEPPLIIFDEFDANFEKEPLGWLKYFLAPMQDDEFRGRTGTYQVGRAIFVFSGGTSYNFKNFKEKLNGDERKAAKLDDFIGRLRGFLDVMGIDEEPKKEAISRVVKLRRAIMLRSLLEKHAEPIFQEGKKARIHDDVIEAFLETKRYTFGVRSMEAIILMSRWIDKEFVPASLPSHSQLEIHADLQAFNKKIFYNKT